MRTRDQEEFQRKKIMLMEKCYDCYAENGLASVGIRKLAESCGCSSAVLYIYFRDLDDLIVQSTAYCMKKVEDDFMAKAPTDPQDLMRFIDEIPYWTARQHGKKYRLMYQVYTHPKYIRYGKQFFEGVNRRYTEYAKSLEPKLGIPYTTITPLIFILIQTCVHYAMFEDECYLQSQQEALKHAIRLFMTQYRTEDARPDVKAESRKNQIRQKRTPLGYSRGGFVCYLCIWPLTACGPWAHQVTVRLMRLTSKEVWDRVCRERSPISRVTEKMSVEAS